jgi:aryl-alcohol dehydrogenase-like predicted oxidoreductase
MDRRYLPALGRPVSRVILGMSAAPEDLPSLYDRFVELGGNAIDTARWYPDEPILGTWLARRHDRDELVIVGKGAHPATQDGPQRVSRRAIKEDLLASLERLRTDWIDVFLLHRDDESVPVGEIMTALAEHRAAGRIRAAAGSNWSTERLAEANAWALANGLPGFDASSPNLSLAVPTRPPWPDCRTAGEPVSLVWYERTQLPLFAWAPLARGYFGPSPSEDDVAATAAFDSPANRERRERARELAAELGLTATQVALAWVLSQPFPTWAVIGARTVAELEESAAATDLHLTPEQVRWLSSG